MTDFEIFDKSLSIIYMQDDLLGVFSLIKTLDDGQSKYKSILNNFDKFITALKKLNHIKLGDDNSDITLEELLKQLENNHTKAKALILMQKHHDELVIQINLHASMAKKNTSINSLGIILYGYSLIKSVYGAHSLADLLKAVRKLAISEQGYSYALEQLQNADDAPYYLYDLLMPTEIIDNNYNLKEEFINKIDTKYRESNLHKKISPNLKKKKLEKTTYYEMLYYVLNYFSDYENYKLVWDKLVAQTQASEDYYIISKDLYKNFPEPIQGNIKERLNAVLKNATNIQEKSNKYFQELEKIKLHADALRSYKRQRTNVSLKQAILMTKINLSVAMLHELSIRLSNLDVEIKDQLSLPRETVVNTKKLPRFVEWKTSLDKLIPRLSNKRNSFICLAYHRIMSSILTKYESLSNTFDDIYKDTAFDDKTIRSIVQEKAKMIANIQLNPLKILDNLCIKANVSNADQKTVASLFTDHHSQIISITKNCMEEFCYIEKFSPKKQYEVVLKETHRHPLYPLITIYSEWYKLRSFILFFESFGNNNSAYLIGFEETRGVAFECLYKDLVYLNYIFGAIYNELQQSTQSMVLKYMAIFSLNPNNPNYHISFKKFAIFASIILSHESFSNTSFQKILGEYINQEKLNITSQFKDFMNAYNESKTGFFIFEINQQTRILKYYDNGVPKFEITITNNEYNEAEEAINELYELDGSRALAAIAMIFFLKNYHDQFLIKTLPNIATFKGFHIRDIFTAWRRAGSGKLGSLKIVNFDSDYEDLSKLSLKLEAYKTSKHLKQLANDFIKQKCQKLKLCFEEDTNLNLEDLNQVINKIDKMLKTREIIKATGESTCATNLKSARTIFNGLYQKLKYIDICCFSQHSISNLKPFKPNRSFIDMMAHYLTKTFVRNEEVVITRYANLDISKSLEKIRDENLNLVPYQNRNQVSFQTNYENDCNILGIIHDSETNREIVPRDTSNKFYVFLKMMVKMCEYYMDSIISLFGKSYDKSSHEKYHSRFDNFLDKLLEDFQIAINTDFKTNYLDKIVSQFKINKNIINSYVIFTLKSNSKEFKENNFYDLSSIESFAEESVANLSIRSFDKVKFFDDSYREFTLIEKFQKTYEKMKSVYNFMDQNQDFIILTQTDLFNIYNIKDEKDLNSRIKSNDTQINTLKAILKDNRTQSFKLDNFKNAVNSYELYLTKHIIFPEYNENTVLACGLLCYEYNQIITVIYNDFLESAQKYQGRYNFKWWHVASLGLGAAIDYFYTTSNLAKGIKKIQEKLESKQGNNEKIHQIINIANTRLSKRLDRKDNVRSLYEFLSNDLSKYVNKKQKLYKEKIFRKNFKFRSVPEHNNDIFKQYSSYLDKSRHFSKKTQNDHLINNNVIRVDGNHPQVLSVHESLAPLNLLSDDLRNAAAINIISDITSHKVDQASMISNGFIDICLGKKHQEYSITLNNIDKFIIKPCRTVLSNEIERGDIFIDINQLIINSNNDSMIILPINHGNWHFTLLLIDTKYKRTFFFDSLGNGRDKWVRSELIKKVNSLNEYKSYNLIAGFQQNNDCGFLVLYFIDKVYNYNDQNLDIQEIYNLVIKEYNNGQASVFLRQHFCSYAGEPFSMNLINKLIINY